MQEIYPSYEEVLSAEFLNKYNGKQPAWGFSGLGYIVFKRTYARPVDGENRTEEWPETIARCIRGAQKIGAKYTKEEAERLFDHVFNLRCSFSGRGLWQLGTKTVDIIGMDSLLNCLAGETKVLTRDGWAQIKDISGTTQEIVTDNGKWVEAPIRSFGKQKLLKVNLDRGRSIYATKDHDWVVITKTGKVKIKTKDLKEGMRLPVVLGKNSTDIVSPQGIQHGLVFGDGYKNQYGSMVDLIDNTYDYCKKYFSLNNIQWVNPENKRHVRYSALPLYYKDLPNIRESKAYLMGFLAGWLAADGSVNKSNGQIRLFNKDKNTILKAKDYASVCGFRTSNPYLESTVNPFNGEPRELWSIAFDQYDDPEILIIRKDHISKLKPIDRKKRNTDHVKVIFVEETDRYEDVYCAVVDDTHTFVIENNILTGNCWVKKISSIDDFVFVFMESMLGGGVGCNIAKEYTHELPRVKKGVKCFLKNTKDADFIVPDSKEGWADLWKKILEAYLVTGKGFSYSTICIRSSGEPLKTFGGIAPGPKPLVDGAEMLTKLLEAREGKKLRTEDVADIICIGGHIVKSGGIRRTALILGGDVDDAAYLNLKRWDLGSIPNYRANSNNSLICSNFDHLSDKFWAGYNGNGEPYGLVNIKNSKRFGRLGERSIGGFDLTDDSIIMVNPCAEATLGDGESCNLADIFLNNIESKEQMLDCAILLYKTQKAIAAGEYLHEETNKIVHENMRLGLGITGACQKLEELEEWSDFTYTNLRKFDKEWSKINKYPQSIRLTVIKPSGTLSLLAGSTPGVHPGFSKYHIRRVRISGNDPLIPRLREAGYKMEPEKQFDGTLNHELMVVSFPASFGENTLVAKDCDAITQLELVKKMQTNWADQAVSVTVYYAKDELEKIKNWLSENYNSSIKTVSFLLREGHGFTQAPLEEITKEQFEEMNKGIKPLLIEPLENSEMLGAMECEGGSCPIR